MRFSEFRKLLKEKYIDIYFKINKLKFKKGNKILLTATDGLGDNIVRQKLLEKFLNEYGNENIIIMCEEKTKTFLEKLGFKNIFIYNSYFRKRVKGKIELIKKIANLGINKVVSVEFNQHDIFVKYLGNFERIAYINKFDEKMNEFYDKKLSFDKKDYILVQVQNFYQEYFNEKINLENLLPNLEKLYGKNKNYKEVIAIGVGSADRKKMLSPEKMAEVLLCINESENKKIVLLGKGELEKKFIEELKKIINFEKYSIEDLTNKLSLTETLEIINGSFLYIGVDSGLYNFAFGFRKNVIAFFEKRNAFCHDMFENIKIIFGIKSINTEKENYFGTQLLNSIIINKEILKK